MILILILLILIILYETFISPKQYKKFEKEVIFNQELRIKDYYEGILHQWVWIFAFAVCVWYYRIPLSDLGIKTPSLQRALELNLVDDWVIYLTVGLVSFYFISFITEILLYRFSLRYQNWMNEKLNQLTFQSMLPTSRKEKKVWIFAAITAGISEEWVFRAILFYYLMYVIHVDLVVLVLIISSFLFGVCHLYQGWKNVGRTFVVGIFLGLLYLSFDSIIPVMLFHVFVDFSNLFFNSPDKNNFKKETIQHYQF